MPPTFLLFLGIIFYLLLIGLTVVAVLVMFLLGKRQLAKKVFATSLVSFPCLLITTILILPFFVIPGFIFVYISSSFDTPKIIDSSIVIASMFAFVILNTLSAIYLWYLVSRLSYQKIDKKPILELFDYDKLFILIKPLLIKLRLYNLIVKW